MRQRGSKPVTFRFWLFYSVIFNTSSASKYLLPNQNIFFVTEVIVVWLEQSKKVNNSNKMFKIIRVIIILCNHHFILLKLFWAIKDFVLYQKNQTTLKSDYNFTSYRKFTDTSWIEELQTRKPQSPIWASTSISRKQQVTGFSALASHIIHNFQETMWFHFILSTCIVVSMLWGTCLL